MARPNFRRLSASNIAASYVAISLIVLILFAAPILYAWDTIVEERGTARLREDAERLSRVLDNHGPQALKTVIDAMIEAQQAGDEKFILLADRNLHPQEGNLPAWPAGIPDDAGTYRVSLAVGGRQVDATMVRMPLSNGDQLLVGRNEARFGSARTLFWVGLVGAAGAVLFFGLSGGMLIRAMLLAEVQGISRTAAAIVAGDLTRRLPTTGETNELDMLAHTVNSMLDQIEQLIRGVRNVSNAVAHDLRTPLMELRSRLEELTWSRPAAADVFPAIESAVADIDRIIAIFNALLRLAEIDNGLSRSGFVAADLTRIAEDAVEFYQPLAEVKGLRIRFSGTEKNLAAGDPLLLAQAVGNLIDNALKYASREVRVSVQRAEGWGQSGFAISVADDGPGIAEEEKDKVTQRFYRGDASRGTPGVGLGLSLVAAVAKLHGGSLNLKDAAPGLDAQLILPE
ncbi:MAG TPA: ATP-binding protein [Burkholderiaceae bacterium]